MTDTAINGNNEGKLRLDPERIYLPVDAAKYLELTTATLAKWRCHKTGPSYLKIGKAISYRGRDLLVYEAGCLVEVMKGAA